MKVFCVSLLCALLGAQMQAAENPISKLDPPRFEVAFESGLGFGAINPPQDYLVGSEFITGRVRWGVIRDESWLRGYHQFYVSLLAQPFFEGIESRYFGFNFGFRYNFVQPGRRWNPYTSGGVGLGWIDSHANIRGAQGQDFTFTVMSAAGISYHLDDKWELDVGLLYEHFSNGGQTDPNPSLNLFGPQVGVSYSF